MNKKRVRWSRKSLGRAPVSLFLFGLIVVAGLTLAISNPPEKSNLANTTNVGKCCDTGDGNQCTVQQGQGQTFIYNGQEYGLIKSNISLQEGSNHIQKTSTNAIDETHWVYINDTDTSTSGECTGAPPGENQVFGQGGCVAIPKDIIVYVCEKNCDQAGNIYPGQNNPNTPLYNAYFRVADQNNIPDVIKNCNKQTSTSDPKSVGQILVLPSGESTRTNLHLNTFSVQNPPYTPWLSPYCKPAIYLYPPKTEPVSVQIKPEGNLTYTLPTYPSNGWNVIANPSGQIQYQNTNYDYLYYEDQLPDSSYTPPTDGFVVKSNNLSTFLPTLVTKLGLNQKETTQFDEYWLKILPKSNYYFIGVMPVETLNKVSPLTIYPTPQTVLRVTLYFKPLDQSESVNSPVITPVTRSGFTVVEWGGIYKKNKSHPFSCYM